ncbi:glutathione S-transferase C-terminal domain-containing protein-like isoform X2 [Watersipora subatra]|uniref:glutathione S-transferase C-terminal domain-containing protein-like isoform X2 n=1 Tax=Watersipora subatra TaxID=2589382 RepID=UPI00355BCA53
MADTGESIIYCEACMFQGRLKVPGSTLLLRWMASFLQHYKPASTDSSPLFSFNFTEREDLNERVGQWLYEEKTEIWDGMVRSRQPMPVDCARVDLPCALSGVVVRSGLTTLLTWMVLTYHQNFPDHGYNHLLGYKEVCFKACAEVSPWTQFVTSHLLPILDGNKDSWLLFDAIKYLEKKLSSDRTVATYKRNYFKTAGQNGLTRIYRDLNSKKEKDTFLTSHLPNLIDILCYVMISRSLKSLRGDFLSQFPSLSNWYESMRHFSGVPQTEALYDLTGSDVGLADCTEAECLPNELSSLSLEHVACAQVISPSTSTDIEILSRLETVLQQRPIVTEVEVLDWSNLPAELDPGLGGKLPEKRAIKKRQQLENLYTHVKSCLSHMTEGVVVDFCSGGGHVGLLIAYLHPSIDVHLIENKNESLGYALQRLDSLALPNVKLFQCNLTQYHGMFDVGVSLHACGVATDLVIDQCLRSEASIIVCPCCYGTLSSTTSLQLPRSKELRLLINKQEMVTLRHSSDKTELGIQQQAIGMACMLVSDLDRKYFLDGHHGNRATSIYVMNPRECSPKNHMIVSRTLS